jgi:hypothetical protein
MLTTLRRAATVAVVGAAWAALTAAAATAAPTELGVHGTQTVVNEAQGIAAMHGGMVGKWYTLTFVPMYESNTLILGSGRELFDGCLNRNGRPGCQAADPSGTLRFKYVYWASFDASTGALIAGHCTHPVVGGTGSFAGARGIVLMRDTPVGDDVRTTYRGTIVLHAGAPSVSRSASAPAFAAAAHAHAAPC